MWSKSELTERTLILSGNSLSHQTPSEVKVVEKQTSPNFTVVSSSPSMWNLRRIVTIEPLFFLMNTIITLQTVAIQSLTVNKICRVSHDLPQEFCQHITAFPQIETEAQRQVANYNMYRSVLEALPAVVFIIVVGPWSDTHGRKVPVLLPFLGYLIGSLLYYLMVEFDSLPPQTILLAAIAIGLTGGLVCFYMGASAYISDITTESERTYRLALGMGFFVLGGPAGNLLGGVLIEAGGFRAVFGTALMLEVISLVYGLMVARNDTVPIHHHEINGCLFTWTHGMRTCIKKREGNRRLYIWILTLILCLNYFPSTGENNVLYLYSAYKFDWTESQYNYYAAYQTAVNGLGLLLITPIINKKLQVSDALLGIAGVTSRIYFDSIIAIASEGWMLFLAPLFLFKDILGVVVRSIMSKCVAPDEVGKVFSILAAFEAPVPILSGIAFSQLYNATLTVYPGMCFFLSAGIALIIGLIFAWLQYDMLKMYFIQNPNEETREERHFH